MKMKSIIRKLSALALSIVLVYTLYPPDTEVTYAAEESVGFGEGTNALAVNFTVEAIKQAIAEKEGISKDAVPNPDGSDPDPATFVDPNFAQAVYDSVMSQPDAFVSGNLNNNDFATMEELLNNFRGTIDAKKKRIQSIKGISMLRTSQLIDVSYNDIADITPISVTDAQTAGEVPEEFQRYYGSKGKVTTFNLIGNPIRRYPAWVGGRVAIYPELSTNLSILNKQEYSFIMGSSSADTPSVKVPLELYRGDEVVELFRGYLDDGFTVQHGDSGPEFLERDETGVQFAQEAAGRLTDITLNNIKSTGSFVIELNINTDGNSTLGYYNIINIPMDRVSDTAQTLAWALPVDIKLYTTVEKNKIETTHSVSMKKLGLDDGLGKAGAVYFLYKKTDEKPDPANDRKIGVYETSADGSVGNISDLQVGEYYFVEEEAPEGYQQVGEYFEFTVENGRIEVNSGTGNSVSVSNQITPGILDDGVFVLGGGGGDKASLTITPPAEGGLDTLTLTWTDGNQQGSAGEMHFVVVENPVEMPPILGTTYVKSTEEAKTLAEAKLEEANKAYQNVTINASFYQKIGRSQKDPLLPVKIPLEVSKKLIYSADGKEAEVPSGTFKFELRNDTDYPDEPRIESQIVTNGGKDGRDGTKVEFDAIEIGGEITEEDPNKDADGNYVYHYVIEEIDEGQDTHPDYCYDENRIIKVEVIVGKVDGTDKLEVKKTIFNKNGLESQEFVNKLLALPFEFKKVDGKDLSGLGGVVFRLYACRNVEAGHVHDTYADGSNLNCWKLREEVSSSGDESDRGMVRFSDLPAGVYQLAEISTKPDYELPMGQWRIRSDLDKNKITITGIGEDESLPPAFLEALESGVKYKLPNYRKQVMPMAGGSGTMRYTLSGVFLLSAAFALGLRAGKKAQKK